MIILECNIVNLNYISYFNKYIDSQFTKNNLENRRNLYTNKEEAKSTRIHIKENSIDEVVYYFLIKKEIKEGKHLDINNSKEMNNVNKCESIPKK